MLRVRRNLEKSSPAQCRFSKREAKIRNRTSKRFLTITIIFLSAVLGTYLVQDQLSFDTLRTHRTQLLEFKQSNTILFSIGFVISYAAIVAFSLPGSTVASITGGFLFGLSFGVFLNVLAATAGATALFIIVRWGIGDFMLGWLDKLEGRSEIIIQRLRSNELSVLLSLRLIPVVPFFILNLLAASVGMKLRNFIVGTVFGMLPAAVVFTWIGVGLGEVFDRGSDPDLSLIWTPNVLLPMLALGVLSLLPVFLHKRY